MDQPGELLALLEATPDALLIVDAAGTVLRINAEAERLFGYPRGELVGEPVEVLVPECRRAAHLERRAAFARAPVRRPLAPAAHAGALELRGRRRDGSEFPVEISLSPATTEAGLRVIAVVRDLTERRRAEQERERLAREAEALRLRDEFLSVASHELKTPLTSLQLQAESLARLARRGETDAERIGSKAESVRRAARRLHTLVNQLLDLSRMKGGGVELERRDTNLVQLVREVLEEFEEEATQGGCALRLDASGEARGQWDPWRLRQIISNLVSNALKYGRGGPVNVGISVFGERVRLAVADQGIGIAAEDQSRLFRRFERTAASRDYGGFGLGLWIVREFVEAHGGTVRVHSRQGAGATFIVELPRGAPAARHASEPARSASEPARSASEPACSASEPAHSAPEPARSASEPARSASEPARTASEPARSASEPARSASEPARSASEPARSVSEPARSASQPARPASAPARPSPMPAAPSVGPSPVLVVDDDPAIRTSFAEALEECGVHVRTAGNGLEALKMLRGGLRPRLILLDVSMPVMDAQGFRAEQLKDPALAHIPVVLVTAGAALSRLKALGAAACLRKPVALDTLVETVRRCVLPAAVAI